jgi:hypothetical protein
MIISTPFPILKQIISKIHIDVEIS